MGDEARSGAGRTRKGGSASDPALDDFIDDSTLRRSDAAPPRDTQPASVHVAETHLFPKAQQWEDKPTIAHGGETRFDGFASDSYTIALGARTRVDGFASDTPLPRFRIGSDSDEGTSLASPRLRPAPAPPSAQAGPSSSDPPTAARRLYRDDHIDLPPGSIVNDEFEIDAKLGAGTMGEVYAARHLKLGKRVALKVIAPRLSEDAAAVERFEQEARVLAQIHHPGIVAVDAVGELADGRAYFVMEYLAGEPLDARLLRGRLPFDEALDILDQIARALDAAHAHGVTHRDLKPGNTFLARVTNEPRPIVKLLDFGLAKLAADIDHRLEKTQAGVMLGTALYISPEQAHGTNVDHRTDIYALGVVAYELILGRPPFNDAKTLAALIAAHLHELPPLPRSIWPDIPPQLDLLLLGLLAKEPAHRPTLAQVRHVIATARAPTPMSRMPTHTEAVGGHRAPPAAPRLSRTSMFVIAGAAMIGGIVIGAAALRSGSSQAWPEPTQAMLPAIAPAPTVDAQADERAPSIDAASVELPVSDPQADGPPVPAPSTGAAPARTPDTVKPPASSTDAGTAPLSPPDETPTPPPVDTASPPAIDPGTTPTATVTPAPLSPDEAPPTTDEAPPPPTVKPRPQPVKPRPQPVDPNGTLEPTFGGKNR